MQECISSSNVCMYSPNTLLWLQSGYTEKKKVYKRLWYKDLQGKFIFLSLHKQGCKSASYAIYTLYYTHKKVRLSVFYLTSHKYSLNCKKERWTIFFLWASLTHHSLFLSNISKFSKTSSNQRIFFNSYPTFLASWNMYLLKGNTWFNSNSSL